MLFKKKIPLVFGVPQESFFENFKARKVFIAELRPGMEGGRIVAQAFLKKGIVPVMICDSMMAFCMNQKLVKDVHIFCEAFSRKTCLCRTGSLIAALSARFHKIPVYLYPGQGRSLEARPLNEIAGIPVTSKDIPTYVPFLEEVPLELVRHRGLDG